MITGKLLSTRQIQVNFNKCLKEAVELGIAPSTELGFDDETFMALRKLAAAYPKTNSKLINKAKEEFSRQLDGTHASQQQKFLTRLMFSRPS